MSDYIIRAALRVTSGPYEGKKTMNNSQNEMVVLGPFVSCGETCCMVLIAYYTLTDSQCLWCHVLHHTFHVVWVGCPQTTLTNLPGPQCTPPTYYNCYVGRSNGSG